MARPLDQGFSRFEFRPGINQFPKWRGQNFDADPATIPPNQVVLAENVNIINGVFESRGGQSKLTAAEIAGANQPIKGIYDTGSEAPMGNVLVFGPPDPNGAPLAPQSVGYVFNRATGTLTPVLDPSPATGRHADLPTTATGYSSTIYSGMQGGWYRPGMFGGVGTSAHNTETAASPFFFDGDGNLFSAAHYGETLDGSAQMTDAHSRIYALAIRDSKMSVRPLAHLNNVRIIDMVQRTERVIISTGGQNIDTSADVFYFLSINKTPAEIYKFDFLRGLSTINNTLGSSHRMIHYNEQLIIHGTNNLGRVDPSTGTYTAISVPAELGAAFYFGPWAIFRGILYLSAINSSTGQAYVITYNGSATATSRTSLGTANPVTPPHYDGIVVAPDGKLYTAVSYTSGTDDIVRIEIFDGSTWTASTILWQKGAGDATGPIVTAGGNPYKNVVVTNGCNIIWDGAGFLIMLIQEHITPSSDRRLFYTKGYDFTTLLAASYPAIGTTGAIGAPSWAHAIRFLP